MHCKYSSEASVDSDLHNSRPETELSVVEITRWLSSVQIEERKCTKNRHRIQLAETKSRAPQWNFHIRLKVLHIQKSKHSPWEDICMGMGKVLVFIKTDLYLMLLSKDERHKMHLAYTLVLKGTTNQWMSPGTVWLARALEILKSVSHQVQIDQIQTL